MIRRLFVVALALAAGAAGADESPPERAVRGARDWAAHRRHFRREPSGETRSYSLDGTNLFHLVALEGGGFVAMAAGDGAAVMGFSGSGELPDLTDGGPLWSLLAGDAARRRGLNPRHAAKRRPKIRRTRVRTGAASGAGSVRLLAASSTDTRKVSDSELDDIRVSPLVQSKWNQSTVGDKKVYNYYTPNGYVCGCVATAMAQLMRYHQYPSEVASRTYTCYVTSDYTETNLTIRAGTYDWDNMPLVPANETITANIQEAIGKLCFDAGVATRMRYCFDGSQSGTIGGFECAPLKEIFGFASAHSVVYNSGSLTDAQIRNGILANLDASNPVLLGIDNGGSAGHAIVGDGYGYADGTLFVHLNMGWSGSWDYWYAIPTVTAGGYSFVNVSSLVYNIFPDRTGELVTGRVTDTNGVAIANATVRAEIVCSKTTTTGRGWNRKTTTTVTTNFVSTVTGANGIYALWVTPTDTCRVTLSARRCGYASEAASATPETSYGLSSVDYETGSFVYENSQGVFVVGNRWGNDLVLPMDATDVRGFSFRIR